MNGKQDTWKDKLIVGIDLGTTKSAVSVWSAEQSEVVMLKDADGYDLTPSVVGWDRARRDWVVGRAARHLALRNPADVVYSIKRYIGRWFNDKAVLYGREDLTYNLISGGGIDPLCDVIADLGTDDGQPLRLAAPQVSAQVLSKLRQDAATSLGVSLDAVRYAVISVPAYFNVLQRRATIEAGRLAGLDVVDIINEPTAAALAYGDYAPDLLGSEEKRILVYDLGGGTFDISLLEAKRDEVGYVFFTLLIDGNTRLGGDDIDAKVVHWLADEIMRRYGTPVRADDLIGRARLRQKAEQAKIALTTQETVTIDLPALDLGNQRPFDVQIDLTREQLEMCANEVIEAARKITRHAVLDVAGLTWDDVDEIILVGGQTLMPAVQRDVEALTGHKARVLQRPMLAVALGAGEYAHIISLGKDKFEENALINVIALPLGIREGENTFTRLVEANSTVPYVSKPYAVTTTEENQPFIKVEVLQGTRDAKTADECVSLGMLTMDVPPMPGGIPKFEIVLGVKSDGTMKLLVTDKLTNRTEELDIVEKGTLALRGQPEQRR